MNEAVRPLTQKDSIERAAQLLISYGHIKPGEPLSASLVNALRSRHLLLNELERTCKRLEESRGTDKLLAQSVLSDAFEYGLKNFRNVQLKDRYIDNTAARGMDFTDAKLDYTEFDNIDVERRGRVSRVVSRDAHTAP